MIIETLLDTDFYKYTMGQFAWKYYPDAWVKYEFKNRTKSVYLLDKISLKDIEQELDAVRDLKLSLEELRYLESTGLFSREYLDFLSKLQLPPVYVDVSDEGRLVIETEGYWPEAIFWETFIMSIVNELYFSVTNVDVVDTLHTNLHEKIDRLSVNPVKFVEFGTRRRFDKDWQSYVVENLVKGLDEGFVGTSNVKLAKRFDLEPIGTIAHETFMIVTGIRDCLASSIRYPILRSTSSVLKYWEKLYKDKLNIALTDTYGTDFFIRQHETFITNYNGYRQDSGNPINWLIQMVNWLHENGVNPKEKTFVFSDGLDLDKIYDIQKEVDLRELNAVYGWGTNLTNDSGLKPLSIVVKPTEVNKKSVVKLSDNIAKATGDKDTIERYKEIFNYRNEFKEQPKY